MTREEYEQLLRIGRARSRYSAYQMLGDEVLAEQEKADLLVDQGSRTIAITRLTTCAFNHVTGDNNPVVARCGVCGGNICATKGCLEHCAARRCGLPVCASHRWKISDEFFCLNHVIWRYILRILGF